MDAALLRVGPEQAMKRALSAGVTLFQYRNKRDTRKVMYETSLRLARMAEKAGALFMVNDDTDIAAAVDAAGVHLGQDDLPIEYARKLLGRKRIIGISTHSTEQATAAEAAGADYIGFGPIFETVTKNISSNVQGLEKLSVIKQIVSIPVIAIGGINHTNIQGVMRTRADGVAVISAVISTSDIKQAAEKMLQAVQES